MNPTGDYGVRWRGVSATGDPLVPSLSEDAPEIEREVVCVFGTVSKSPWVTDCTANIALETAFRVLRRHQLFDGERSIRWTTLGPVETVTAAATNAQATIGVAAHVRDLSGLSTERVARFFPVTRETFQRWVGGVVQPGSANLERLLRLQYLFQEARGRVPDVRAWLLAPLSTFDGATPGDLLEQARLTAVWQELQRIPPRYPNPTYVDREGHRVTQVLHSTRGALRGTAEDELDDLGDWAGT